ncbi:MAG: ABC transporter permease [Candidatus Hodarchaeales archaeon]
MRLTDVFNLRRVWGLTRKELAVLVKDKPAMIIIFLIPTVLTLSANMGRTGIIEPSRIGLIDNDNSEGIPGLDMSQEFVELAVEYHKNEEFLLFIETNQTLLYEMLGEGEVEAVIILPDGMEYNISVGYPTIIEVRVDSLNLLLFQFTQQKIESLVNDFKAEFNINGIFNPSVVRYLRPDTAVNLFDVAPFFFPWTLFSIATLVACQVIVSDIPKHRMALTPTNKFEISIAKISGIQILLSFVSIELIILSTLLGLQVRGNFLTYFFVLWIISLSGVTLGYMLSTFAKTPLAALQFFIFFFLLQAIVIFFIPWEEILYIFPVYNGQFLMLNGVIRGQNLRSLHLFNVIMFIITTYVIGYLKYRRLPTLV